MYVFNITTKMTHAIEPDWLKWARDTYIRSGVASGYFTSGRIMRLLDTDEEEGPTYAMQLETDSRHSYDRWVNGESELLMEEAFSRWGSQFISFKSLLSIVN